VSERDVEVDFIVVSWSDNGIVSASEVESDLVIVSWSDSGIESDRVA
jgi:hypothetical protein